MRTDPMKVGRTGLLALAVVCAGLIPDASRGAALDGAALLDAAQAAHDPMGIWPDVCLDLELRETRPKGADRRSRVRLEPSAERFEIVQRTGDGPELTSRWQTGACSFEVDGSSEISAEVREEHRLNCERLTLLKDYYTYLWGLPMKLSDPGTLVDPKVERRAFDDRPADVLRVTYAEDVGSDVWLFFLEPETHHLMGYQFFKDEETGKGEIILLSHGLIETETGLTIPKERAWYTNLEREHLGTDILESVRSCR